MITANLEKVFFHYVLNNPALFSVIETSYFQNKEIKHVYGSVRDEYLKSKNKIVPSITEIADIATQQDKNQILSKETLGMILKIDMSKYREDEYIKPRLDLWLSHNKIQSTLVDVIEKMRDVENHEDLEEKIGIMSEVRGLLSDSGKVDYSYDDIGVDFDDPEAHDQDIYNNKIATAWPAMNALMGGGFDVKTLNVLMGQTNVGKSVWMHNIAANAADFGYNVLVVSLEMSETKVLKRIGSKRLRIPIKEYDKSSQDKTFMGQKIQDMKKRLGFKEDGFESKSGKIFVKEFPAGTLTVSKLDAYVKRLQEVTGKKIDMIVVDYIGILAGEKGTGKDDTLYTRGKHLAESLRAIGQKYGMVVITATQLDRSKFDANDINLQDMPESRAIADTADSVWAIIRTPAMKANNVYNLKALKLRDSDFMYDRMRFELDKEFLNIIETGVIETDAPTNTPNKKLF